LKKGSCVGISKGGKTTKIHITTDKKARPIRINLSAGNINDCLLFEKQISGIHLEKVSILADRAYSTYEIIESLTEKGATVCIPPKSNMKNLWDYDKNLYKFRNKVERFFQTLKNNRRIATRYEKLDDNFLGFVYFHSILFWLK
jgi:transposase